ncbi:DUF6482 family protein [Amphritea pacifica]|uniref:Uncharacterized protein n=1 Tax=Amphritea pacifica TaxID=2811233 RepID=A0ABS2WAW9_9GAMM|nr:DUF6482 family protein [Amphritea pacifica]MBN0988863.1 hypothetical protein [Amphritea pacifica]
MNQLEISELEALNHINQVTVHSLERMIYQVTLQLGETTAMLTNAQGKPARFENIGQIRELLQHARIDSAVMLLPTTFDEMIGRPPLANDSRCEILLGWK